MPDKTRKAAETADERGVVFAQGGKGAEYILTCHGYDMKCKGGWRKCQHITEDHRSKVAVLDVAGHFRHGNNNNNGKSKKGTVNVATGSGKYVTARKMLFKLTW